MSELSKQSKLTLCVRRGSERGSTQLPWLDSRHTFSFGDYVDPDFMGYRDLCAINEDRVSGGGGFPMHEHRSMEIFTYVIDGALKHEDNMGNSCIIKSGELQYLSSGTGVKHSEVNASQTDPVHFLQVWIEPKELAGEPHYSQLDVARAVRLDGLVLLASPVGEDGALKIDQDAELHYGQLRAASSLVVDPDAAYPHSWLQVMSGSLEAVGETLSAGDGFACKTCEALELFATEDAQFLFFRLR